VYFGVVCWWLFSVGVVIGFTYLSFQYWTTGVFLTIHSAETYKWLLMLCCMDFVGVSSVTIAYANDSTGFISLMGYMTIVYGYFSDLVIFNQPVAGWDLLSALVIAGVTISVAVYKFKTAK
jgi:hypothetical protein